MGKLVFSAPRRMMLKLKDDLAKELNTNDDYYGMDDAPSILEPPLLVDKEPRKPKEVKMKFRTSINEDEDISLSSSMHSEKMKYGHLSSIVEEQLETERPDSSEVTYQDKLKYN